MMKIPKASVFIFTLSVMLLICLSATAAEVEIVTNNNDSGAGSLRQAIIDVDTVGTINFDNALSGDVITLSSEITINKSLTIKGPGANQLSISGQDSFRIFNIQGDASSVDISGLSFTNGNGYRGGAIFHQSGNLTISSCDFTGNTCKYYQVGGAIYSTGEKLTVNNCSFTKNIGSYGGAICVYTDPASEININSSYFSANSAGQSGGAIYFGPGETEGKEVNIKIENSEFQNNTAGVDGGAIIALGPKTTDNLQILSCNFSNNDSTGSGGAIGCSGTDNAVIEKSYFSNNSSPNYGGAISLVNVTSADINSCVLSDNNVDDNGGAIYSKGDSGYNPIISLKNSTINGNSAGYGGGIAAQSYGTFNLLNCTIADNSATGNGGGIKILQSFASINISNCTIYGNSSAKEGWPYGSAISNNGTMNLKNTIVACNTYDDGTTDNQIYNGSGSSFTKDFSITSDDVVSSNLFSGDLEENDGPFIGSNVSAGPVPLRTLALVPGSPAIDMASSTDIDGNVVSQDQRGVDRPKGLGYDIGAYELIYDPVYYHIGTESSPGGYFDPVSADVLEGTDKTFTVTPYDGFLIEELFVEEQEIEGFNPEGHTYTFENVSSDLKLRAEFMIDPAMTEETGVEDIDINGTTKGPQSLTDPKGIAKDAIRSISFSPVSSSDIGEELSDTNFATGLSFEIGFVSPDAGTAITQLDLMMEVSRDLLGAETCDAIDSGADIETAFFENVSIYKMVSPDAYDLFEVASADFEATDFFVVSDDENNYYLTMNMVIADKTVPLGVEPVLPLVEGQESYFFIYDGKQDNKFTDPIVVMTKSADPVVTDEPVDTPDNPVEPDEPSNEPTTEGGTCSIGTFTPLAGLLVLPLLLMFKK